MRRPVKATETEAGLFLLVNERLRMRLPSFYRPTEDLTTNLKPGVREKKGELWWGVTWHSMGQQIGITKQPDAWIHNRQDFKHGHDATMKGVM